MAAAKKQQSIGPFVAGVIIALTTTAAAQIHPRGDATCGGDLTAADLVATARAVGGESACDNDDCDRDGAPTAADVDCAAGCLFGYCPVPEHAPRLTGIAADSAPAIVPGSAVRVAVANLGPLEANKRVVVNGLEAEVLEQTDTELLVVLPVDLPTGPAELVVVDGDLPGAPIPIEIGAPLPLGAPDTLDGMLGLVDATLEALLALDVEAAFGENAAIIRQEYARYRQELGVQRAELATDPTLDEAARIAIDAAVDASGAAEALRALLDEIEGGGAQTAGSGGPAQTGVVGTFRKGAQTIKVVGGVVRAAGAAAAATTATISAAPIVAAIAAGLAINAGAVLVGSNPLTPLITGITYLDADGRPRQHPTAGGIAMVRGHNFDTVTTELRIGVGGGTYFGVDATAVGDAISYRLPAFSGFCGKVTFELARPGGFVSNPVLQRVQPELLSVPNNAQVGELIEVETRGAGCEGPTFPAAFFDGVAPASSKYSFVNAREGRRSYTAVPFVLPGNYKVSLLSQGLRSEPADDRPMEVRNSLTGLTLTCPSTVVLPATGAPGAISTCEVSTQPAFAPVPMPSTYQWSSSSASVARVQGSGSDSKGLLTARNIGTTNISVTLEAIAGPFRTLASSSPVQVTVVDNSDPTISLSSTATSPVQPGASIPVTITASDNSRLLTVSLTATGDAVASGGSQEILDCVGQKTCTAMVTVGLKASDFSQPTVTITATARDAGANTAGSNTLTYTIARDTSCPTVSIQQPAAGGTVNAGETVTVVAVASDSQPDDTGVKSFVYSASGAALAAPVPEITLPLPMPQAAPTLRFNFSVKQPDELTEDDDLTIAISVAALDAAMPPNNCGPQIISVSVIGVLDTCSGGITTDNPSGYIGEPFTVTVALTGAGADEITRVTSINPGGQFDLQSQGGGVYSVTLFYQGTGGFTLRFVAFDAGGEERCAGTIGLESLGPEPEAGVAAHQRGRQPAGGSLRP
jgi:hypothetical protein